MKPVFKQNISSSNFYPYTSLNEIPDLRIGILTIREKWMLALKIFPSMKIDVEIPDNLLPDIDLFNQLLSIPLTVILNGSGCKYLQRSWDLFQQNSSAIISDFQLIKKSKQSADLPLTINYINKESIFIDEGATVHAMLLDASEGPIYIGKGAIIMHGSILKGPISIGEKAKVKFGTIIYEGSAIGPQCTVGGEIKNSNIMDFSNKAHHGYLGDSVVGKWCNLGAGTSVSNIKNNASIIRIKDPLTGLKYEVGQKCGMIMGDFSKSAINSSFNSGSIIGICSNIFHTGVLLPSYIPDFSWGDSNQIRYDLENLIRDISRWMSFKNSKPDENLLRNLKKEYNK